ncbi:unnamed protein product [Gongylonema pulchrum]|uniref:Uncharacterized protein n=1 Tax=Gongylonema pulchrum TaxID=637853 RepID=A0A183DJ93_9BILA|nr:unnamed protein product [Gongylonema pulchrum]
MIIRSAGLSSEAHITSTHQERDGMVSNEPQRTTSTPEPVADKNEKIEFESPAIRNTEKSIAASGSGIADQSELPEKQTCEKQVPLLGESEVTNNDTGNVSRPTLAIQSGKL